MAFADTNDDDQHFDVELSGVEENDINLVELKLEPPYVYKMLKPSNGKNPEEPKNEKYTSKTYFFDITKCDEIFYLLVTDDIIVVPTGLKLRPIEQRKKRGYCKYHGYLYHNTSRCVLFRDIVQKNLDEGRLKFGDKQNSQMQVDASPLGKYDVIYVDVAQINMVDFSDDIIAKSFGEFRGTTDGLDEDVVMTTEGHNDTLEMATDGHKSIVEMISEDKYNKKMKVVYPKAEEDLIDFLDRCRSKDSQVMLCPKCSAVFDKEAAKGV